MALSDEQMAGITSRLKELFGEDLNIRCPLCAHNTWEIRDGYLAIPIQEPDMPLRIAGGKAVVYLPLTCLNCSHVVQFDVYGLGLAHLFPHLTQE